MQYYYSIHSEKILSEVSILITSILLIHIPNFLNNFSEISPVNLFKVEINDANKYLQNT